MDDKIGTNTDLTFNFYNSNVTASRKFTCSCLLAIMLLCIVSNAVNVKAVATTIMTTTSHAKITHISNINIPTNSSSSTALLNSQCQCVIFRLSGIQDYFARNAQLAIMDLFLKRNQSLALGLIMNSIGNDTKIVGKVLDGSKRGVFELAINGWNFTDYSKLAEQDQKSSLIKANEKMQALFGKPSNIFIPPYETFSNSTLSVMHQLGMNIISSDTAKDKSEYFDATSSNNIKSTSRKYNGTNQIYHMPVMTSFRNYDNTGKMVDIPIDKVISDIEYSISKYGYAIVNIEPSFFLIDKGEQSSADLNEQEINNISNLIDRLISKNIHITTFSKVTGIKPYAQEILQSSLFKGKNVTSAIPSTPPNITGNATSNNTKVVILTFDDGWKSQYTNVKPILDKYDYRATFFIVCNYVGKRYALMNSGTMSWQDIEILHNAGYDIEAHTMNHAILTTLSSNKLDFEVGQSKQCLKDHGINATIIATPFDAGWNNATVINTISKYFDLSRNGNDVLTFLHCDGWPGLSNQTDCRTYAESGKLNFANRYSLRGWNHNFYDSAYHNNSAKIFAEFVKEVNRGDAFNRGGVIKAIPIIIYHNVDNTGFGTNLDLFAAEMKYLHNNGFKVLTMSDMGYDEKDNILFIKRGVLENAVRHEEATASSEGLKLRDSNLKVDEFSDDLSNATSMSFLDRNHIFVLDKNKGIVQTIVNGTILPEPILDVNVANQQERGMLGIALGNDNAVDSNHGNKLINPKLLLNLPASSPSGVTNIQTNHMGGKVLIGPDNNVYVGIGDVVGYKTQSENNKTGSPPDGTSDILRVAQNGQSVLNGPLGDKGFLKYYYAYGIRNSFGMDFDPLTGKLWDTENGPTYGDELNIVEPGFNSGWSKVQGLLKDKLTGIAVDPTKDLVNFNRMGKYKDPQFVWNTPVGVTALKFLNSDKLGKQYKNTIFVGHYDTGNLYNFKLNPQRTGLLLDGPLADKVANVPHEMDGIIFEKGFGAITDIQVGQDGNLYILTYHGPIYKIHS